MNNLFVKIWMYFLSLIIPIIIIGSITYFNMDQTVKTDTAAKLNNNLISSAQTIDIYFDTAQTVTNNLLSSHIIKQYIKPYRSITDEERVYLSLIIDEISHTKNPISSFIQEIFLFVDTDRVYTSQGMVDFDTFFTHFYAMERYDLQYWKERQQTSHFFEQLQATDVYNNEKYMTTVIPIVPTQYVNGRLVTMATNVEVTAVQSTLRDNALFETTNYIVKDSYHSFIINELQAYPEEFLSEMIERLEHSSYTIMELDKQETLITAYTSEQSGWTYYSFTPTISFSKESASVLRLVFNICIALTIIGVIFSFIFSFRLYNPIRNIRNILIETDHHNHTVSTATGKAQDNNTWHIIDSRVKHLMEQNRDVTLKLNEYSNELLDQLFFQLIREQLTMPASRVEQILHNINFVNGQYIVSCLLFQYKEQFYRDMVEAEQLLIQSRMKRVLWGLMKPQLNCYLIEFEANLYACVIHLDEQENSDELHKVLEDIQQTFNYDMIYCELNIGLGNSYSTIEHISKSFNEAITAIGHYKKHQLTGIADATHLSIEEHYYYPFLEERKIINYLKTGHMESLREEVLQLLQINQERDVSYSSLGILLVKLWNTGERQLVEWNLDELPVISLAERTQLSNTALLPNELDERVNLLLNYYEKIIAATTVNDERSSSQTIAQIMEYIDQNYCHNIYLEKIAEEFSLSAKYISRLFKDATGDNLTDHIAHVRITKAKQMLINTDLKVSDIAEQVGVHSRTTFLRMFKKYEGIPPSDYQKLHRKI